ncbi:hypothetical protein MJO10_28965, partial [Salmonella enterica subsp. enterica serovar Anatum]|nr:hypothetical protein [Salmonella enterica subsp. enterica serovar Anatum]
DDDDTLQKARTKFLQAYEGNMMVSGEGEDIWYQRLWRQLESEISQLTNRMRSRDYDMMPRLWRAMPWPSSDLQISWASEYIDSSY